MKQKIIFAIVGGLILFIWQFLSYAMPNFHKSGMEYTQHQDAILEYLDGIGLEEGQYFLAQPDPSLSQEEQQEAMEKYAGKPWAVLNYQKEMSMDMVMPLLRGLLVCFITAFILFWLFTQQRDPSMMKRIWVALAVGLMAFFYYPYSTFIWFKDPDIYAYFADGIVPWIFLGIIGHKMDKRK